MIAWLVAHAWLLFVAYPVLLLGALWVWWWFVLPILRDEFRRTRPAPRRKH